MYRTGYHLTIAMTGRGTPLVELSLERAWCDKVRA
jgi:hypothetical protein